MNLLVIRHALAMDRDEFAQSNESDDLRPLTPGGAKKMKRVAKGLRSEVGQIDILATSPLLRARQTADIIADEYGLGAPEVEMSLVPGTPFDDFAKWLAGQDQKAVVAVVGHEPHLGSLVTWLLTGKRSSRVMFRKGGACLLELGATPRRNSGSMTWMLTPRQLRKLAK